MNEIIGVLNHGYTRIVDSMGSDLSIVRNARVSFDAEWRAGEDEGKDAKLIDYLVKNNHTSPFESVKFTFEVKAPIFVLRQWHRHRTWSYNEISARYAQLPQEYYIPEVSQITTPAPNNKQSRTDTEHPRAEHWQQHMDMIQRTSYSMYESMLQDGVPRELARSILPLGMYSHMFATVDLLNLMRFLKLRMHEHAQYEIRVYAKAMLTLAEIVCPVAVNSFSKHWLGIGQESS